MGISAIQGARIAGAAEIVAVNTLASKLEIARQFGATHAVLPDGSANVRLDFDRLLRLWRYGKVDLEGMISRRIKLEEINDAFRAMQAGEVVRSVITY